MRALDVILKKRAGESLSHAEIRFLVGGYVDGSIPEYQVSAFLMAVFFRGMTSDETGYLTREMIASGDTIDLSSLSGPFIDKHSTGGVGDKVSLILAPMAAACGVKVPMMSGRSLGHTGGTLDKLESIPGYSTALSPDRFARIIDECGFAMTGQSDRVVPADRRLYALRDVTGTVESIPLITGSILSKKFAEGADALVFDVKTGPGAFMKDYEQAKRLAESLVSTGRSLGKQIVAVLTRMDYPLGAKVGNFLEVEESLALVGCPAAQERVPVDERSRGLREVTLRLGAWMVLASGGAGDLAAAEERCVRALEDGSAWERLQQNIKLQGGDLQALDRAIGTVRAPVSMDVPAPADGVIQSIDAYQVGMGAVYLGAGRSKADDDVYPDVGFEVLAQPGDTVTKGQPIATAWGHTGEDVERARDTYLDGVVVGDEATEREASLIIEELSTL